MAKKEGYIIEFHPVGNAVKVSAIDPVTLKEVSIIAPKKATRDEMMRIAVQKLEYVINKEKSN